MQLKLLYVHQHTATPDLLVLDFPIFLFLGLCPDDQAIYHGSEVHIYSNFRPLLHKVND